MTEKLTNVARHALRMTPLVICRQRRSKSPNWYARALTIISEHAVGEFTGEEVRQIVTLFGVPNPPHPNAWGRLISAAIRNGIVEKTGRHRPMKSPKAHGRETPILRKLPKVIK